MDDESKKKRHKFWIIASSMATITIYYYKHFIKNHVWFITKREGLYIFMWSSENLSMKYGLEESDKMFYFSFLSKIIICEWEKIDIGTFKIEFS